MSTKKIVFTGPECSGKTTICRAVAQELKVEWVEEYARQYLEEINRPYKEEDLLAIAKGQIAKEQAQIRNNTPFLLCDTSMLVIKIWSLVKYGRCHPWIEQQLQNDDSIYFLCKPNIPWVADPLRESPDDRERLFLLYEKELLTMKKTYIVLQNREAKRKQEVIDFLRLT